MGVPPLVGGGEEEEHLVRREVVQPESRHTQPN